MLDLGWTEMFVIALVALIVIGPKELPRALKTIAGVVRRMRAMAREFQSGVEDVIREAELDEFKRDLDKATRLDVGSAIENTIDPTGSVNEILTLEDDTAAAAATAKASAGGGTAGPDGEGAATDGAAPAAGAPAAEAPAVETPEPAEPPAAAAGGKTG